MRKLVLPIVVALAVAGAALFGWKAWTEHQRDARYDAWRQELLAPAPPDDPGGGPDETRRAEVIAALKKELKEDPGLTNASLLLAELLLRSRKPSSKDLSEAKLVLADAVKRHPDAIDAALQLGRICRALGLVDETIRVLVEALVHADGTAHARVELDLGNAYLEKYRGTSKEEDFRSARNAFQEARSDPSTEAEALEGYGALWLENGRYRDFDKALATYRELLKKHPDYPDAARIQGVVDVLSKPGG